MTTTAPTASIFRRYFLPGFVFQSVVVAGGYGTGRELVEFFLTQGPLGGLLAMGVSMVVWSAVCMATFEFARVHGTYDYRHFFQRLLGRGWILFEIAYVAMLLLVLAVIAAAAGTIGEETFGVGYGVGVAAVMGAVGLLVFGGSEVIERFLAGWSFLLYGLYALFFVWCLRAFGADIAAILPSEPAGTGWVWAGVRYAGYNLAVIPAVLMTIRTHEHRRESLVAGALAGPLAILPGVLFYIAMVGQYPGIVDRPVPANLLLEVLGSRAFQIAFQVVLFGTLIETGTGLIHAVNERIAGLLADRHGALARGVRPAVALGFLAAGALVSQFGLVGLIASGYGTITLVIIAVYVVPVLTRGVWQIRTASVLLVLAVLWPSPLRGQIDDARGSAIDSIFTVPWDAAAGPGCVAGVVRDGALVHARGYGMGNLDHGIPLQPSSVFYLASVSKQFTAAAVVVAEHEGFLSLDDDVRRFIPEFPDYGPTLTIRHLVHHTAGVRDYLTLLALAGVPLGNVLTDEAMLDLIVRQRELNFPPGTEFLYSNSGYVLLAEIVERATGRSLKDYTEEKIFRPLGMASTHFHDDAGHVVPGRVFSYERSAEGEWKTSYFMNFDKVGDGGLYSTVEDLARWDGAFYADVLGVPDFAERMYTRGALDSGESLSYARGLTVDERRGLVRVSHGGSLMGFRTMIVRYPERRSSVITLCNTAEMNPARLGAAVEDLVLADEWTEPPTSTPGSSGSAVQGDSVAAPPALSAEAAAALAGRYASDELGATWVVEAEASSLVLRHPSGNRLPLVPRGQATFATRNGLELAFEIDGAAVQGFVLQAGRVRNIRFIRQP